MGEEESLLPGGWREGFLGDGTLVLGPGRSQQGSQKEEAGRAALTQSYVGKGLEAGVGRGVWSASKAPLTIPHGFSAFWKGNCPSLRPPSLSQRGDQGPNPRVSAPFQVSPTSSLRKTGRSQRAILWPGISTLPAFSQLSPAVSSSPRRECWSLRKAHAHSLWPRA